VPGGEQAVSLGGIRPLADLLKPRNVGIAVDTSVGRTRRRTLGPVPEFQVAQDLFDHDAVIGEADDFQRAGAARANEWVRFVGCRFILHLSFAKTLAALKRLTVSGPMSTVCAPCDPLRPFCERLAIMGA
jgi:hypothetical protein